jgi:ribosomal protein S18 acetylase RimI-like enzyme
MGIDREHSLSERYRPCMIVRSLGYRTDLMVRRLAGSSVEEGDGYLVVRTPQNPGFYWGNFLLVPPPIEGTVAAWAEVFAAEFPGSEHLAIGIDQTTAPAPGWLADAHGAPDAPDAPDGLEVSVSSVLTAEELRRPPPPSGRPDLRSLSSQDDWDQALELHVAVGEEDGDTTGAHRIFLERKNDEARFLAGTGRAAYFGAFLGGRLCATLGIVADTGGVARFQTVETLAHFRRRGLAGGLVGLAADHAWDVLGSRLLVIVADPDGPAIGLYRSLGFEDREHQVELTRGVGTDAARRAAAGRPPDPEPEPP